MELSDEALAELVQDHLNDGYHLSHQPLPSSCAMAVFGRYSAMLAQHIAHVIEQANPALLVISGNKGKDSGPLLKWGIPEAHYLLSAADSMADGVVFACMDVAVDLTATNGAENAARMVELLLQHGWSKDKPHCVVVLAHQVQMWRLGLTFNAEAERQGLGYKIEWSPSLFEPDFSDPVHQWEVLNEYVLLYDKSEEGLFPRPDELDLGLVSQARIVRDRIAATVPAEELTTAWTS